MNSGRRTAKEWENIVLRLETQLYESQTAFQSVHKEMVDARMILGDLLQEISQDRPLLHQVHELKEALRSMVRLITSGEHYQSQNPYTRPQVREAFRVLGLDPYGEER